VTRGRKLAVSDDEDVLARALAHHARLIEQDRLVEAGLSGIRLGENRVQVLPRSLGVRDQPRGRDPPPRVRTRDGDCSGATRKHRRGKHGGRHERMSGRVVPDDQLRQEPYKLIDKLVFGTIGLLDS